ncbi:hypothetical protein BRPE64_DCDS07690 (plasmid) [Caballeronia insecticola]|uniref:Uncharacterized protein n=1 Tax=Caballeronia insecticola TaxID=758793 RepID=R4X0J7_9BURK|nr:hypothetical protein BRPE64_DCDS07690 [Caballeronia insecticola]
MIFFVRCLEQKTSAKINRRDDRARQRLNKKTACIICVHAMNKKVDFFLWTCPNFFCESNS